MRERADHLRGLTSVVDNTAGSVEQTKEVSLCPGAEVYSYTIIVSFGLNSDGLPVPLPADDIGATLRLQDSELIIYMNGCRIVSLSADLPGLAWPAFARLVAAPHARVTLYLSYGNCK